MEQWGDGVQPALAWGLFTRGLGLVYVCAFVSLGRQIVREAGRDAALPVSHKLARIARDFPGVRRFVYFPSLLWVNHSDAMLRLLCWGGVGAAALVIYGGPASFGALLACYVCYLSLDVAVGLIFPWECLLFETGFFALFLPPIRALPALPALAAPAPALAWAYRLLLVRVLLGFGKQKFIGSTRKDLVYLKSFLLTQPLPTAPGWYAQKLPAVLLKAALLYMLIVELIVPFAMFVPGAPSVWAALATALLMLGIALAGNYSFFNWLTLFLCLPLLDSLTPTRLHLAQLWSPGAARVTNSVIVVHTLAAVLAFAWNSWVAQTWTLWVAWFRLPRWLQLPVRALRLLHPLRWLHPYGVFPPNNAPSVKISLLVEASWDGQHYRELEFRYSPSNARSAPSFVAPHHPRADQNTIYEAFGLNSASLISSVVGPFDPYAYGAPSAAQVLAQRIVEGRGAEFMRPTALAEHASPPRCVRMTTIVLEPVSLAEHHESGAWWKRSYIGPHSPPRAYDPQFRDDLLPEPELWHFEAVAWRERCPMLRRLMAAARAGDRDPMQLALLEADGLGASDVARFWDELVPLVGARHRDLDSLPELVAAAHQRWDRVQRRALQRLLGRFSLLLVARWEPLYLGRMGKPLIAFDSYFELWLLAQHVIGQGRDAYLAMLADPMRARAELGALTPHTGLYYLSLFRFESMRTEAQKLRMLAALSPPYLNEAGVLEPEPPAQSESATQIAKLVTGLFGLMPTLRDHFKGPRFDEGYPERYPSFRRLQSGEIVLNRCATGPTKVEARPDDRLGELGLDVTASASDASS